jgi:hypothetical protein
MLYNLCTPSLRQQVIRRQPRQISNSRTFARVRSRGARRPGCACIFRPKEGVANAGCPMHPRPRVRFALAKKHTSKRVHRNHPASPHAMALRLISRSPVIGLSCHRHPADMALSKPGRADLTSANLTPASRRQDHTTSPYAATSLVRVPLIAHRPKPTLQSRRTQNAAASTASAPRVRDDHDASL